MVTLAKIHALAFVYITVNSSVNTFFCKTWYESSARSESSARLGLCPRSEKEDIDKDIYEAFVLEKHNVYTSLTAKIKEYIFKHKITQYKEQDWVFPLPAQQNGENPKTFIDESLMTIQMNAAVSTFAEGILS
jgi:hypothetical protein